MICMMWKSVDFFYDDDEGSSTISVKFIRLNKAAISYLVNLTKNDFRMTYRNTAVLPILEICASLRFLATGSYQQCVGNGLSHPMVSVALAEFLKVMENKICSLWINSEMTEEEKENAKRTFFSKSGIPGIIQAVGGTHIRIISPGKDTRHAYYNRKGFYFFKRFDCRLN